MFAKNVAAVGEGANTIEDWEIDACADDAARIASTATAARLSTLNAMQDSA